MKVQFSVPRNGWIELQFESSGCDFNESISYTPNDFLFELATALSLALQGMTAEAFAYCEPTLFIFAFSVVSGTRELWLQIEHYPCGRRQSGAGRVVYSRQASRRDIVIPFWRALRRLQGMMTEEAYRTAMHHEFPSSCVERLSQILWK